MSLIAMQSSNTVLAQEEPEPLFSLYFTINAASSEQLAIANSMKAELAKIGIEVIIEQMEGGALTEMLYSGDVLKGGGHGGSDMYFMGSWWMPTDYLWYIGCFASEGIVPAGWNTMGWNNGEADLLLKNAMNKEYDQEKRTELMHKWQELFYEDMPAYVTLEAYWAEPNNIRLENRKIAVQCWDINKWTLAGKTEQDDTTVRMAAIRDVRGLNPLFMNGGSAQMRVMFRQLWNKELTDDGTWYLANGLAESEEQSEDAKTITINLRDDVLWHDGEPFTAEDVLFTWEGILDPDTFCQFYGDLKSIIPSMDAVESPDPYTIIVHLEQPMSLNYFKTVLGSAWGLPLPKHILKDVPHSEWQTHETNTKIGLPGTGPMKLVTYEPDSYIEYEAFDDFYGGRPFIDHFIVETIPETTTYLAALEKGDIDFGYYYPISELAPEKDRINSNPELDFGLFDAVRSSWICFNNKNPILSNPNVRKAISYMIPIDHLYEDIYFENGKIPNGPVLSTTWGWNPDIPFPEYNPEKAKELLLEAGYPDWPPTEEETPEQYTMVTIASGIIGSILIGGIASYILLKKKHGF